ncbi:MAG TPA: response regulator [Alphaproteobacteria bacterium]|nr:response regulator [Alphaproteobacteria bacterium]
MGVKRMQVWRNLSIQAKMLVIILPLVVMPMLILAAVGFVTSSREAAKASTRYLKQRENDLHTLAENPIIRDYFNNRVYGLREEAEVYRLQLEHSMRRFAERSNSIDLIYPQIRYISPDGEEVAKVVRGQISNDRGWVREAPFFVAVAQLPPGEAYVSPVGPTMIYAMPVYQPGGVGRGPLFQGAVVLDFVYPLQDFEHTTAVIARTFVIITGISLGIALLLTITRVRRLTDPIRRLAEAAHGIAHGQRGVSVEIDSDDEVGRLAHAFNDMAVGLERHEAALQRKVVETTTLYEIGQEISAQVAFEPTLRMIVERTRDLLRAEVSLLALRQGENDDFLLQAYNGMVPQSFAGLRIRPGEGLVGRVVSTGQPLMVGDYLQEYPDSPFLEIIEQSGLRSAVAVPLKARHVVIGVLYVYSRTSHNFREEDRQLLSALANQAAIAIENAKLYQQVRQHAEELEARVRERTQELEEANLKLEAASRHKSEFLANMSHELRTPMNAIIGFTRLVMRRAKDILPARDYDNLGKILVSADHLLNLINDILDLSKIEAGRMEVHPTRFELGPLLDECVRTIEPLVKGERLHLVKEIEPGLPALFTDQDKLKQVLVNLLGNAVKFTEEGTISMTARQQDGQVALAVADTGIGIPEDKLELIFEEFRQADSSTTRRYSGTGLGLSISRRLVHLLGGDIVVQSAVGVGSTFTVLLPLRYDAAQPATRTTSPLVDRPMAEPADRIVLAIDDDPDVIYLLRENLAEAGYRVVGAGSGEEGMRLARTLRPCAITLDILMPHKDGWQILHELKADPITRDTPVIVLSIVDNKELGNRLGAFDYLLKPFDREAILGTLAHISPHQGRLLVVDDDPQVVDLVRQILEGEPYEVVAATDGQAALEAIAQKRPDVVLLDLLMPEMDGFTVLEQLQQDPETRHLPVIVLTAKTLTAAEHAMLEQRARKVLQKRGLDRDTLLQELRNLLQAYPGPTPKG